MAPGGSCGSWLLVGPGSLWLLAPGGSCGFLASWLLGFLAFGFLASWLLGFLSFSFFGTWLLRLLWLLRRLLWLLASVAMTLNKPSTNPK